MLGERVLTEDVFGDKGSTGHGDFKLILYGIYGVFFIEKLTTILTLKMKKIGVIGAKKRGKIMAGNELGKDLFKE